MNIKMRALVCVSSQSDISGVGPDGVWPRSICKLQGIIKLAATNNMEIFFF